MAKAKKSSLGTLIARIVVIAFAVLSFVAMTFKFYAVITSYGSRSNSQSADFEQWIDGLASDADDIGWWKTSRVFMIITLVVVAILAVVAVVQFFYNHKILNMIAKFGGIAGIVLAIVFLLTFIVGCVKLSSEVYNLTLTVIPHAGPIVMAVSSIVASACAVACGKK